MAFKLADRVKETAESDGTSDFDLDGAAGGFETFVDAWGDGNEGYYVAAGPTQYEIGVGTIQAGIGTGGRDQLQRDTVIAGSNGTSKVDFTDGQTLDIFGGFPADRLGGTLAAITVFTASGTWTKTAGARRASVKGVGAGGGGAAAAAAHDIGAGGGGAGEYGELELDITDIASVTVTIGGGGLRGAGAGGNGNAGGDTSFGTHMSLEGGGGGTGSATGVGGAGGTGGSGGDLRIPGGNGGVGGTVGGQGGASAFGGGGQGGDADGATGGTAPAYGSGGGGATAAGSDNQGGNGADGVLIVREYY